MAKGYIRTEYGTTVVLSNIRKGKSSIPVIGMNDSYTATKVSTWWDGSPMTPEKADGSVYLRLTETGEYFRVNLPNDGELFLEKDTVDDLRAINPIEVLLLRMGYYKGVKLNGYYQEGDTPAPIEYYLSDTTEEDDGGSIFEVGDIKLEHEFTDILYTSYFGVNGSAVNNSTLLKYLIEKYVDIRIDKDVYCNNILINGVSTRSISTVNGAKIIEFEYSDSPTIEFVGGNNLTIDIVAEGKETKNTYTSVNNKRSVIYLNGCGNSEVNIEATKKTTAVYFYNCISCKTSRLKFVGLWNDETPVAGQALGRNYSPACWVTSSQVITLDNFDVTGSGSAILVGGDSRYIVSTNIKARKTFDNGVYYSSAHNSVIQNSSCISTSGTGFKARGSGNRLSNLTSDTSNIGISITDTSTIGGESSSVYYCNIKNTARRGIEVAKDSSDSYYTRIIGNTVDTANTSNTEGDAGIAITQRTCFIEGNVIKNITVGYGILKSHPANAVSTNDYISNNHIDNVPTGMRLQYMNNGIIQQNTIKNVNVGVEGRNLEGNLISGNIINEGIVTASILLSASYNSINNLITSDNLINNISGDLVNNTYITNYNARNVASDLVGNLGLRGALYNRVGTVDLPMICIKDSTNNYKFVRISTISLGTSSQRPTAMMAGHLHVNTTTGAIEYYNGTAWVNAIPNASTTTRGLVNQATAIPDITTADATDETTAIALINELKAKLNAILATDRTSGQRAT